MKRIIIIENPDDRLNADIDAALANARTRGAAIDRHVDDRGGANMPQWAEDLDVQAAKETRQAHKRMRRMLDG